jgi:hypothetical protein
MTNNLALPPVCARQRGRGFAAWGTALGLLLMASAAHAAAPIFINSPGNQTMQEDGTLSVTAEVFDADGDPIFLSAVSGNTTIIPNSGLLVSPQAGGNGVRTISITPAPNQNGAPTQITLSAVANGESVQALFLITVASVNDAPITAPESYAPVEDTAFSSPTSVLANDSDLQGGAPGENNIPLTAVLAVGPSNAAAFTLNSNGSFSYTPAANFNGTDSFTYRARDSLGAESLATTVTLNVSEVNDVPVAADDLLADIAEDSGDRLITGASLIANDSAGPANEVAQTLTVTAVSNVLGGSVDLAGGNVTFSPTPNYFGPAGFDYTVTDNGTTNGAADPLGDAAAVSFTISEVNDAPLAQDDTLAGPFLEDAASYAIPLASLTANDSPGPLESGQTLTVTDVSAAVGGSVSVVGSDVVFVPTAEFFGAASFSYEITDDGTTDGVADPLTDTATVSFTVEAVNDQPTLDAIADPAEIVEDSAQQTVNLSGISEGPANESGQTLTITASSSNTDLIPSPSVSYVEGNATGSVSYTAVSNRWGTATITVTVQDNGGSANGGVDTITRSFDVVVTEVNDAPLAADDSLPGPYLEDAALYTIASSVLLGNDNAGPEESGQTITVTAVSAAVGGSVSLNGSTVEFIPDSNYSGAASFSYEITDDGTTDGVADPLTDTATVSFTVEAVNDQPTLDAIADPAEIVEDSAQQTVNLSGISEGPANESGQTLTITASSSNTDLIPSPSVSYVEGNATGSVSYTAVSNRWGTATITVTVQDNGGSANGGVDTITRSFDVVVTEVNDAPLAADDSLPGPYLEDAALYTIASSVLLGNDNAGPEESGQTITVTAVSAAVGGSVSLNGSTVEFIPDSNYSGAASFSYEITDDGTTDGVADPLTDTATVSFTVEAVNDQPTLDAIADPAEIVEDSAQQTVNLSGISEGPANESGQTLTITASSSNTDLIPSPSVSYVEGNATGSVSYTAVSNRWGTATITVTVQDNGGSANGGVDTITRSFDVVVTEVNDAPLAADDSLPGPYLEDAALYTIASSVLLGNDNAGPEESGQTITVTAVSAAVGGSVSLNGSTVEFIPDSNYSGAASFSYEITDDGTTDGVADPLTDTATVSFTVEAVNDQPTLDAIADPAEIVEDSAQQTVNLSGISEGPANESGQTLTITASSSNTDLIPSPSVSYVEGNATGSVSYTAVSNRWGTATITVTVQDNGGSANGGVDTITRSFDVVVTEVNDAPLAADDSLPGPYLEDAALYTIASSVLLGNDNAGPEESGQTITVTAVSAAVGGSVSLNGSTVEFIPDSNYSGAASFSYEITDDGTTDGVADPLTDTATVSFTVEAVNDQPTLDAIADPAEIVEDSAQQTVNLSGISEGPANESGQTLTITASSSNTDLIPSPSVSYVEGNATGSVSYTAVSNRWGTATITVTVQDNGGSANGGVDTITRSFDVVVTEVNDAPLAADDAPAGPFLEDAGPYTLPLSSLTANDSAGPEESAQTLTIISVDTAVGGSVNIVGADAVFLPTANYSGAASFTYTVTDDGTSDGVADPLSDTATVSFTIEAVNDTPTVSDVADQTIDEDTATGLLAFSVGDVETDPADLLVTASSSNQALVPNGNLVVGGSGANRTLIATPLPDQFGSTTITLSASDGDLTGTDTFVLTVTPINDPPRFEIFPADIAALPEDAVIAGGDALSLRVVDPEGTTLTIVATSGNQYLLPNANLGIGGSGNDRTVTFTLATDKNSVTAAQDIQSGSVTVTVVAFDAQGASTAEDFIIQSVTPVNDAPTFTAGAAQNVLEDAGLQTVSWASNFRPGPNTATDENAQTAVQYTLTPLPGASVNFATAPTISTAGVLTYQTALNDFGTAAFEVRVVDSGSSVAPNNNTSAAQTLFINVQAVNDAPVAVDDNASVIEDAAASFIDVLDNDSDVENDPLAVTAVTQPTNGSVSFTAAGVSYTPAADFFGSDSFTYTVSDGALVDTGTVTVDVLPRNDAPSFDLDAAPSVLEDSGAASLIGFLSNTNAGPANESAQQLSVATVNDNNALFAVQPSIDLGTGTLSFTPGAHAFGVAEVSVTVSDDGGTANGGVDSSTQTFLITVTGVNDAPSFAAADPVSVLEDSGAQTLANWAAFNAGPSEGSQSVLAYTSTLLTNPGLFAVAPTVSNDGSLSYTAAANAFGSATFSVSVQDDGGTANGGIDSSATQTFTITVTAVNDAPGFIAADPATVLEDAGAQTVPAWATFNAGPGESDLVLGYTVSNLSNAALFAVAPTVANDGSLSYTPAANAFGSASFDVVVQDNGGTANGGIDTSAVQTFTITVTGVNDAPSFVAADPASVLEDAGAQTLTNWAAFSAGPGESDLVLGYTVSNLSNAALFDVAPTVSTTGTLSYTPAENAFGSASFDVVVQDDGGTANGGIDNSTVQTFTITVTGVNDAPSFSAANPSAVDEDAGAQTVASWAVFNAGPGEGSQSVLVYTVSAVSNPALFAVAPTVSTNGTLSYTAAANASGSSTFSVQVQDDGGTANGGIDLSAIQTFTLTVNALNDDPIAGDDSLSVLEDAAATAVDVLANDTDIDAGDTLVVTAVGAAANGTTTLLSGTVRYVPAPDFFGSDSFTYEVSDGNGGSATGTVTVNVTGVNDVPSFTVGPDQAPAIGQVGLVVVPGFMSAISPGPANESAQSVCFLVDEADPNGITSSLAVACNGTLSYTLTGAGGVATVTVRARDDGGTANGGVDTSAVQTFTITAIDPVADLSIDKRGRYIAGNGVVWTLEIGNAGPSPANGARVIDTLPTSVTGATWTCVGNGGGSCAAASGSGDIDTTLTLPNGAGAVITITATLVDPNAATVINTASVQPPMGITDPDNSDNSSTLDLQVALFADGFEDAGFVMGKLAMVAGPSTLELDGSAAENAVRGVQPQDFGSYSLGNSRLLLQGREVSGLIEVRLLQRDGEGLWETTRWIELWPGDAVRVDYSKTGGSLQTRLGVGPK